MKKLSLVLVSLLVITCGLLCCSYAEPLEETTGIVSGFMNIDASEVMQTCLNVLDKLTIWVLPFCAGFLLWGAVQYFIMGIRNLYKKKQGLFLMFGSMTFYVVIVALNLILSLVLSPDVNKDIIDADKLLNQGIENTVNEFGDTTTATVVEVMKYVAEWALPFCAILAIFGAVQYFIMGIRNLYKKRQGLLLMFGSITFYVILLVVNFIIVKLIG